MRPSIPQRVKSARLQELAEQAAERRQRRPPPFVRQGPELGW